MSRRPVAAAAVANPADDNAAGAVGPQIGISNTGVNTFAICEEINDKLKILDYEDKYLKPKAIKAFSRTYFAVPTSPAEQFPQFSQLSLWLFKQIPNCVDNDLEWEFDAPDKIAGEILSTASKIGYKNPEASNTSLRSGCGEHCLTVIVHLIDTILQKKNWKVNAPLYAAEDPNNAAKTSAEPTDADTGEIEDDVGEDMGDELDAGDEEFRNADVNTVKDSDNTMLGILESTVKAEDWLLELERVGPMLKIKKNSEPTKEWRTHMETSVKHEKELADSFPEIKASLSKLGDQLRKAIERISSREKHINQQFEGLGGEFREKQVEFDKIRSKYNELSQSVSEMTQELTTKSDEVESIKASMTDRNSSMTDTQPLKRIQTALASLKKEVKHMELRIGVLGQTLLQHKIRHPNNNNATAGTATGSPNRGKGSGRDLPEDDDDLDAAIAASSTKKGGGRGRANSSDDDELELF